MFGGDTLIVGLWFVPLLLCFITPLIILLSWYVARLLKPMFKVPKIANDGDELIEAPGMSTQDNN